MKEGRREGGWEIQRGRHLETRLLFSFLNFPCFPLSFFFPLPFLSHFFFFLKLFISLREGNSAIFCQALTRNLLVRIMPFLIIIFIYIKFSSLEISFGKCERLWDSSLNLLVSILIYIFKDLFIVCLLAMCVYVCVREGHREDRSLGNDWNYRQGYRWLWSGSSVKSECSLNYWPICLALELLTVQRCIQNSLLILQLMHRELPNLDISYKVFTSI